MSNSFIGLLNTSPFFATRPFVATFLIGLVVRFTSILEGPDWFASDTALIIMGVLALIEIFGTKTDLGRFLDEFTPVAKGIINYLLVLILIIPSSSEGVVSEPVWGFTSNLGNGSSIAGWGLVLLWPLLSGGSVWLLSWLRSSVLSAVIDLDEDDDLGVQGYFSWIEDIWTVTGTLVALFFPLLALIVYGVTLIGLFLIQRYIVYIQEKRKVACHNCHSPMFSTALYCSTCHEPNMEPRAVGIFGQALERRPTDPHLHHHNLITRKRCPSCATRLPNRTIHQTCMTCGTATFPDAQSVETYLNRLRQALPKTLAICLALSFVPILGILPGVIYYRLAFISSMRGYVRRRAIFFIRWGLILFNILLVSVQWIPFVGALSIPIMCLTNYWVYQQMIRRAARRDFNQIESTQAQEVSYAL